MRALQTNIKARIKAMWQKPPFPSRLRRKPQQRRLYRAQAKTQQTKPRMTKKRKEGNEKSDHAIMHLHTQPDDFQRQHRPASFPTQPQISHLSNRHIPKRYRLSDLLRASQQSLAQPPPSAPCSHSTQHKGVYGTGLIQTANK